MLPLLDLTRQVDSLEAPLTRALHRVLMSGNFILGPEVRGFEKEFSRWVGCRFGAGVASGTDALELALRAAGVKAGDLVATVSFTFLACADSILHAGARPLFVEIDPDTFTLDPEDLQRRLRALDRKIRRRVKAVLPVHLYGHPCGMDALMKLARREGLIVIEDAAQASGARWGLQAVGSFGTAGCFSFFPTKGLGAFGDGGFVSTNSRKLDERIRRLRVHGRGRGEIQQELGRNSRLDELQAAILRVKLRRLKQQVQRRRRLALEYTRHLSKIQ
ncbi:MAG: DegT/DnrJ/EryC1/StrS family aminotransferase, partial [Candidatus Omnitrophica bacterium]|nr:DegT/DnrJ/EryC1/StrS family aminotransferase [Candidatus Omnitrophota bacterium]